MKSIPLVSLQQLLNALSAVDYRPLQPLTGKGNRHSQKVRLRVPEAPVYRGRGTKLKNLEAIAAFVPLWTLPKIDSCHERLQLGESLSQLLFPFAGQYIGSKADMVNFINAMRPGHAELNRTRGKRPSDEPFVSIELASAISKYNPKHIGTK